MYLPLDTKYINKMVLGLALESGVTKYRACSVHMIHTNTLHQVMIKHFCILLFRALSLSSV